MPKSSKSSFRKGKGGKSSYCGSSSDSSDHDEGAVVNNDNSTSSATTMTQNLDMIAEDQTSSVNEVYTTSLGVFVAFVVSIFAI